MARGLLAPGLVEGHLEEVGRCHVLQPCPVGPLGADGAVLVGPDSVLEVAAEGEALTWPGSGRLKLCSHLGLLLSWLDLLLLLLLPLFCAADLLGRSLHLLLLHLLLLLHWQWAEEHLCTRPTGRLPRTGEPKVADPPENSMGDS